MKYHIYHVYYYCNIRYTISNVEIRVIIFTIIGSRKKKKTKIITVLKILNYGFKFTPIVLWLIAIDF